MKYRVKATGEIVTQTNPTADAVATRMAQAMFQTSYQFILGTKEDGTEAPYELSELELVDAPAPTGLKPLPQILLESKAEILVDLDDDSIIEDVVQYPQATHALRRYGVVMFANEQLAAGGIEPLYTEAEVAKCRAAVARLALAN